MKRLALLIASAVLSLSGCVVHAHDSYYARSSHSRHTDTVVYETHVHDESCGHAWDGGTWVFVGHHRHYYGCGHYWYGSRWCLHEEERPVVVVERHHSCHAGCGHYWDGGRWVVVERHHHGPGCGHVIVNGYWTLRIR